MLGRQKPYKPLFDKLGHQIDVIEKSPSENLLEIKGAQELVAKIETDAKLGAQKIIATINTKFDSLSEENNSQAETKIANMAYTILRELQGLIATHSGTIIGATCEQVYEAIKLRVDDKLVNKIEMHHGFTIYPEQATILKEICPDLFPSKTTAPAITAPKL